MDPITTVDTDTQRRLLALLERGQADQDTYAGRLSPDERVARGELHNWSPRMRSRTTISGARTPSIASKRRSTAAHLRIHQTIWRGMIESSWNSARRPGSSWWGRRNGSAPKPPA